MIRILSLMLCGMAFTSANAQRETQNFTELNIGLAAIDDHSFDTVVPGISLLFGRTIQFSNNNVAEVQVGAAAPTLITGKLAAGIGTLEKNVMLAVRPWPLTIGPQLKRNQFTWSFEFGTATEASFDAGWIVTAAYRWDLTRKQKE